MLALESPVVLLGNAGTGKTTWMRWTFRQLLRRDAAVPFFFELRAIAKDWGDREPERRTFLALLEEEIARSGAGEPRAAVRALLQDESGPRPVVLVDGWDELGELGEELRARLTELHAAWPRAQVLVSSRPYGEHRPAGCEGFATLEIQPLHDDQMRALVQRFHRRVYGQEEDAANWPLERGRAGPRSRPHRPGSP
ncbi:MAG: NACHT domain-containing protein [Myxococcales bacterium]|nr:NACHT domain-containing protein [Myxococcales bacterium]